VPESAPAGAPVTDLMAALRASIEAAKGRKTEAPLTEARGDGHDRSKSADHKPAAKSSTRKKSAA
jgi:hypothetical protein